MGKIYLIIRKSLAWVILITSSVCYSQSYTFTPCNNTGQFGPSQLQANSAYLSTNLNGSVVVSSGIQSWTVPASGAYRIEAYGAKGGNSPSNSNIGGSGAVMKGDFNLTAGQVFSVVVGQLGGGGSSGGGGGGGGSGVMSGSTLLIAAGGGGGAGWGTNGVGGATTTTGASSTGTCVGGTLGSGGTAVGNNGGGCGGGGLAGPGAKPPGGTPNTAGVGGFAAAGGVLSVWCSGTAGSGGFGIGGGGGGEGQYGGSGGGGGYSGGGGGEWGNTGWCTLGSGQGAGGGGSYNTGANQTNVPSSNNADGMVIITKLCNINLLGNGVANNVAICSGNSLTLTTNAVSNYTWSTANTTNTMIVVSPTASQTYSVIGTSTAACQAFATISVTVNSALPILTITNTPNSICLGKTATLTAGGAVTYTWAGGSVAVTNGQSFLPTSTANYTVTGQNGCGITTSVTTITIAPLAMNVTASPSLNCSGNPAVLTVVAAATSYTWFPGPLTGTNVTVVPAVTTVYTVSATDGTCSGLATVTIIAKPNPTLTIVPSNTTVCQGALVTMTASGALTYTWTSPSSNAPNISDNPTGATLYQVSGTNSVNCVSSANQLVFTQASPTVVITSNKIFVCSGDPVTLTASGATTYNWTNGPATAGNLVNPTGSTAYTVTGTTSPCSGTAAITINVLSASVLASVATPSICNGATAVLHASGAGSYVWVGQTTFNGNANVTPSITTTYTVNATTTSGTLTCPSSTNITVTVFNNPTVTIAATKSVVCKADANVVLTAGGANTYTWSTATVSANISVHPQSTTTYTITGVDANGCMNTASKVITVNACNGIAELTDNKNNILIYPNPSNGEFVVSADSEISLKLINELGQEIRTIKLSEQNEYKVPVTNLANGVYFVVGQNNTDKVNQKIVVAK